VTSTRRSKENLIERCGCESMAINSNRQVFCLKVVKGSGQESMNTIGCPFKVLSGVDCAWDGSPSEVMGHVMSSHAYETQEKLGPFAVQLQSFFKCKNFYKTIHMLDTLFYLLWVIKEDIIHFLVFVIPKKISVDYPYQISEQYAYDFKLQKGEEQIAITGSACGIFSHHESKVLETGESSDCTAVQCKTLLLKMVICHV